MAAESAGLKMQMKYDVFSAEKAYPLSLAIVNGSRFSLGSRPVAYRYAEQQESYPTREAAQAAMIAKESQNV